MSSSSQLATDERTANGVDRPNLAGHRDLLDRMADVGVLVSDVPPGAGTRIGAARNRGRFTETVQAPLRVSPMERDTRPEVSYTCPVWAAQTLVVAFDYSQVSVRRPWSSVAKRRVWLPVSLA